MLGGAVPPPRGPTSHVLPILRRPAQKGIPHPDELCLTASTQQFQDLPEEVTQEGNPVKRKNVKACRASFQSLAKDLRRDQGKANPHECKPAMMKEVIDNCNPAEGVKGNDLLL